MTTEAYDRLQDLAWRLSGKVKELERRNAELEATLARNIEGALKAKAEELRSIQHLSVFHSALRVANKVADELDALRSSSASGPAAQEKRCAVLDAYWKAQDLWSSQCFCFTSAPESLRREAHEVARDGFNAIEQLLSPLVAPWLRAEHEAAAKQAKDAKAAQGEEPRYCTCTANGIEIPAAHSADCRMRKPRRADEQERSE